MVFKWLKKHVHIFILALVLAFAAFSRFWAAPLSSGPDINQFWSFAVVFHKHGLDFYKYASGNLDIFPNQGWGFAYPPVWLLLIGLSLLFVPSSISTTTVVDTGWRVAMKTPIIAADLGIGLLLYWAVPGPKWRKLLFTCLWLFHPTAWFESGVFGQFDAVAAAFLLACAIMLIKGRDRWAFVFAGLAVMTKQHTAIPLVLMLILVSRNMSFRRLLTDISITAGIIALISVPFLATGNFGSYATSLFASVSGPDYQSPVVFSFSGSGTILTYLHNTFGFNTLSLFVPAVFIMLFLLVFAGILCYKKFVDPLQAALAGFLIFVVFFYRINYQYLITYIPLALLLASSTRIKGERIASLIIALLPAVWVWITNLPWWFTDKIPRNFWVSDYLRPIGLGHGYLPDYVYVMFVGVLAGASLVFVVLTFTRWRRKRISPSGLQGQTVSIQS